MVLKELTGRRYIYYVTIIEKIKLLKSRRKTPVHALKNCEISNSEVVFKSEVYQFSLFIELSIIYNIETQKYRV